MRRLLAALGLTLLVAVPVGAAPDPLPPGALARLGSARLRQGGGIHAVLWLPGNRQVVTGGAGHTLRVWDAGTGEEIRRLDFGPPAADAVPGVPEDADPKPRIGVGTEGIVNSLACSPDGRLLASGTHGEPFVRLWDLESGEELGWLDAGSVGGILFSEDGSRIVTAGWDSIARVWDTATREQLLELPVGPKGVPSAFFAEGTKKLLTLGVDMTVRRWDGKTGAEIDAVALKDTPSESVYLGEVSSDFAITAALFRENDTLYLWDCKTGDRLREIKGHDGMAVAIAFSPDHRFVATVTREPDNCLRLWDTATGKLAWDRKGLHVGHPPVIVSAALAFSADGKTIACGAASLRFFETGTGKEVRPLEGHHGPVLALAVSPDGRTLASGGVDYTARLWDAATGKLLAALGTHEGPVTAVAFAPDGKTLATGSGDQSVRLWDTDGGKLEREFTVGDAVESVAFAPDGKSLAVGGAEHLSLWDLASGKSRRLLRGSGGTVAAVAFTPDGKTLAAAGGQHIRLWDVAASKEIAKVEAYPGATRTVAFSADGRTLYAGGDGEGGGVTLWSAEGVLRERAHGQGVTGLAPTPDGRVLALAGGAGTEARLWEVAGGTDRRVLAGGQGGSTTVAISSDGRRCFVGGADGTILLWPVREEAAPTRLSAEEVESAWRTLEHPDAAVAERALRALVGDPAQAAEVIGRHLHPTGGVPRRQIAEWVRRLDNDDFAAREQAAAELNRVGPQAELALWLALTESPSEESFRRCERLLTRVGGAGLKAEPLRNVRAVEVLERAGTPATRRVLERLAGGASDSRLTDEARAALSRLGEP